MLSFIFLFKFENALKKIIFVNNSESRHLKILYLHNQTIQIKLRKIIKLNFNSTYEISKMLSKILSPLTNLSDHKLKNSLDAKECLQQI